MSSLPPHSPRQLSLGPLETEILELLWELKTATVKDIHDLILADPDRDLAYASVTTVLRRLAEKGWVSCDRADRAHIWQPLVTQEQAQILKSHNQLNQFLKLSNPDIVAAFANELDLASVEKLEAIAQRIKAARQAREE